MDSLSPLLREAGLYGYGLLGLAALLALVGLVAVGGWATNRRVPPLVVTGPLTVATVLPLLAGGHASHTAMEALAHATPELRAHLVARAIQQVLGLPMLSLALVAVLLLLVVASGGVAVARGPRSAVEPIAALLLGIAVVVGGAAAALAAEHLPFRSVVHGLFLLPVVVGLAARPGTKEQPSAGALAASLAATAYAAVVVLLELAALHVDYQLAFSAVANASAEMKGRLLESGLVYAQAGLPFSWLACLAAFAIAVVGVVNASERDRPLHNALLWLSLLPVVALLAQLAFDPAGRLLGLLVELAL